MNAYYQYNTATSAINNARTTVGIFMDSSERIYVLDNESNLGYVSAFDFISSSNSINAAYAY